jgi:LCP family protein required for cell wall assembly
MMPISPQVPRGRAGMTSPIPSSQPPKRKWRKVALLVGALLLVLGGVVLWKAGFVLNKISTKNSGIFQNIIKSLPGVEDTLKGEEEGRINILLLGMRGAELEGGGLLADTIMVLSVHPSKEEGDQPRASLISIPRDLYVTLPGTSNQAKINAVHAEGEKKGAGEGLEDMKRAVGEVTGQTIHYAVSISFKGFTDLVDALGGVDITLKEPFSEGLQFREPHVCDPYVFTVPTNPQQYEYKYYTRKDGTKYVAKAYPLCYNKDVECGGVFSLPAGENHLDGSKALCYARARYSSNDFERAKRQQMVLQALKERALSLGTLADFSKINGMIDALGNNVRTDMQGWELKRLAELYPKMQNVQLTQKVLEDSEEGLLYAPGETNGAGYILLPRGDNYDRIRALFHGLP